jgi:hypothetical protein
MKALLFSLILLLSDSRDHPIPEHVRPVIFC